MSSLVGPELVHYNPTTDSLEKVSSTVLDGKKVLFYFSAHWCPPCRMFSPLLVEMFNELRMNGNQNFNIVFVTSDRSEEDMKHYMKDVSMPWYAMPFGVSQANEVKNKFAIRGIPTCILLDENGNHVSECPLRGDIEGIKKLL